MFKKFIIVIRIIVQSLVVGLIAFYLYKALFNSLILASIVAVATTIFLITMGELVLFSLMTKMRYQKQLELLEQIRLEMSGDDKRKMRRKNPQKKIVVIESTAKPIPSDVDETGHDTSASFIEDVPECPQCHSGDLKQIQGHRQDSVHYVCSRCGWQSRGKASQRTPETEF